MSSTVVEEFRKPLEPIRRDFNQFWYTGTPFRFIEFADYVHAPFQSQNFNINEEGFRGPIIPRGRIKGRKKIACFGSSVVTGIPCCSDSETLSGQLAIALASMGIPCDVANFGVIGSTIKHDLNLALRKLSEYDFDAVILLNGYNDLSYAEEGNIWHNYDVIDESLTAAFEWRTLSRDKTKLFHHALKQFFTRGTPDWQNVTAPLEREKLARAHRLQARPAAPPPCFEFLEGVFLTHLELFSVLCRIKEIPFIHSFQPSVYTTSKKLSEYEQAMMNEATDFGSDPEMRELRLSRFRNAYFNLKGKASTLLQDNSTTVDLDPVLADFSATESAFYDHCHLLAPAYRAVGEKLAGVISAL